MVEPSLGGRTDFLGKCVLKCALIKQTQNREKSETSNGVISNHIDIKLSTGPGA